MATGIGGSNSRPKRDADRRPAATTTIFATTSLVEAGCPRERHWRVVMTSLTCQRNQK
jgi:hypothetical protein